MGATMSNKQKMQLSDSDDSTRLVTMHVLLRTIFLVLTTIGVVLSVFFIFSIRVNGEVINQITYYYIFLACFIPGCFLVMPGRKNSKSVPWYDLLAAAVAFAIAIYLALHEYDIRQLGWSTPPDMFRTVMAGIYALFLLEVSRRIAGWAFVIVSLVIGLYPLVAEMMPGMLYGKSFSLAKILGRNIYGYDGLIGLPCNVVAQLLLGFLIFAAMLISTGAGNFFLNISLSVFGKYRGGPAKVAVIASAFFGSLSGNALANIVGTGSVTIPTMKRCGFSATYAGAIEACASSGGIIMPPVMGAIAFVMASFLGVSYSVIMVIAIVPSVLYFFGLLMQVDAYAARCNLVGLEKEEIPDFWETLKGGWTFVIILAFLVWGLVYMKWDLYTPYYASALMVALSFLKKETMLTPKKAIDAIGTIGKLICQTCAAMLPMTFVLVGVVSTGVSGSMTASLVHVTGGNVVLILLVGVLASYILGMAGLVVPAYLFLALSMAPAAIEAGDLNVLAVHMFIVYYALIGGITPPVAPGAFVASTLSGANPMATAFTASRLGIVLYFIPFFFIFNPALIFQGSFVESAYLILFCLVGITMIAGALEGYLVFFGRLSMWMRCIVGPVGFIIAFPELKTTAIGAIITVVLFTLVKFTAAGATAKPAEIEE
jgi:TRAP transporter 4TM/12TM fusion protein